MKIYRLPGIGCLCGKTALAQQKANLVPTPEFRVDPAGKPMQFWSPRSDLQPWAGIEKEAEGATLRLGAVDFSSFGKWMAEDIPVHAGICHRFEVLYKPTGIVNERGSVGLMLSWNGQDGKPLQRDYVDQISSAENGWRRAARTLRPPQKSASVTIELWLRWTSAGSVGFRNPSLVETSPRHFDTITRARTLDNGVYLVASVSDAAPSRIVSPDGEVMAERPTAWLRTSSTSQEKHAYGGFPWGRPTVSSTVL